MALHFRSVSTVSFGDWAQVLLHTSSCLPFGLEGGGWPKVPLFPLGYPLGDHSHLFQCRLTAKAGSSLNTLELPLALTLVG